MRAYLFYTAGENSQDQTKALAAELELMKVEINNLDADSVEGTRVAELYDITQRPAAVVARDDGGLVHRWLGMLPAASEISYYVHSL